MLKKNEVHISKFLSLVLRHQPQKINITLDENGWTDVETLITQANKAGIQLDQTLLKYIVETNPKQRFTFDTTGQNIRANQGHSVEIELGYQPQIPPYILYHGTALRFVDSIKASGLQKQSRHHVHLSQDVITAQKVGSRHGKPVILEVLANKMAADGFIFFCSENGVWLTDHVPTDYLQEM